MAILGKPCVSYLRTDYRRGTHGLVLVCFNWYPMKMKE